MEILDELMGSGNKSSNIIRDDLEEKGAQNIVVAADQINSMEFNGHKADSFIVDIEKISSPHSEKDVNANSRFTKCLSRKGMQRGGGGGEKNTGFSTNKDRGHTPVASPRATATLVGASMQEVMVGATATDHSNPQLHNSITIMTGGGGAESLVGTCRRFSFRRPPSSWTVNPRRILIFFATISSMGTILLIYFTLSISKLNRDDSVLN